MYRFHAVLRNASKENFCEFSVIYWSYLLNWIDFQLQIGHDYAPKGGITTRCAKHLNLIHFFGKQF